MKDMTRHNRRCRTVRWRVGANHRCAHVRGRSGRDTRRRSRIKRSSAISTSRLRAGLTSTT